MRRQRRLPTDLHGTRLEDRTLLAAAPTIASVFLTTSGYIVATPALGMALPFAPIPLGANSIYGLGIASGFYVAGFGMSAMQVGNPSGLPTAGPASSSVSGLGGGSSPSPPSAVGPSPTSPAGAAGASPNLFGQSLPLSPGSGFRYIGQTPGANGSLGTGNTLIASGTATPPVGPVAPMGPIVSVPPPPAPMLGPVGVEFPSAPMSPSPSTAFPALPGILPTRPLGNPPLSGTLPPLQGTVPTPSPGPRP